MDSQEKRLAARIECTKLVHIKFIDADGNVVRDVLGHIQNISKSGIRIESPLPVDTKLIMVTTLDSKGKSIGIRSVVVYCSKNESSSYILGIKFDAPEASCTKFIKAVAKASRTPIRPQAQSS